jgi:hypothetical protein
MVWAVVAVVAVLGVGLPAAGWWATTRRPARVTAADRGHGEIDHWLADQFGLGACDRERVRAAVLAGHPVSHPGLEAAVRELAARVLARRFRPLRRAEKLGSLTLAFGLAYAAFGMAILIIGSQGRWQAEALLGVINGAVLTLLGWYQAIHTPRRVRRNAEQILQPSRDATGSGQ